jgi:hypothetical protein
MSKLLIENLRFSHFVVATNSGKIFVSSRDTSGHIFNFIIDTHSGEVSEQIGGQFVRLDDQLAAVIKNRIEHNYAQVPVYRTGDISLS